MNRDLRYSQLGCACTKLTSLQGTKATSLRGTKQSSLGAVSDYDQITIAGKTYTVNQILDKVIVANNTVTAYSRPGGTKLFTINKGEQIGKVISYLRADQNNTGKSWLMFEKSYNNAFYVSADQASSTSLKDQGALTVAEEQKKQDEVQQKNSDPISYYFKKLALPVLITGGVIYTVVQLGKTFIAKKVK